MRMIFPMLAMLICGLSLGAGGVTLFWSGQADRSFAAQREWKVLLEKSNDQTKQALHAYSEMKRASDSFEKTANECLTFIKAR